MVVKSIIMLSVFFLPLIIINTGIVSSPLLLFILYISSGLGMAGIGMGIMHDAIHGSYSKNRRVNQFMGYSMNLIGANVNTWKIQHNVLHHTYTNIDEVDDDIGTPFFLRFSPHAKKYRIHKFQHFYIWFFYALSTISWITLKDFVRIFRYRKLGFFKGKNQVIKEVAQVAAWKLLYYSYALVLPLIMVPLAPWIIIVAFLCMHFVTGIVISIVFQTAHVMPNVEYPLPDTNGNMADEWAVHQLATTTNFAPQSKLLYWLVGGLNYQVEHHLMPNICHVHYKELSHIVAETAKEYGIPYNIKKTFGSALGDHIRMLRQLGSMDLASSN